MVKKLAVIEAPTKDEIYTPVVIGGMEIEILDETGTSAWDAVLDTTLDKHIETLVAKGTQGRKRKYLHASDILKKEYKWHSTQRDFCYRQCVLAATELYEPVETFLDPHTRAVYENGEKIHERWQHWFELAGISLGTEVKHKEDETGLRLTTDAIVDLYEDGRPWIAEIKGYQLTTYNSMVWEVKPSKNNPGKYKEEPPEDAHRQLQLYMHMTGIHIGIVLVECKNDQKFHTWECFYQPELIADIIIRINTADVMAKDHMDTGNVPERICESITCSRARECGMKEACFMDDEERDQVRLIKIGRMTSHDLEL